MEIANAILAKAVVILGFLKSSLKSMNFHVGDGKKHD